MWPAAFCSRASAGLTQQSHRSAESGGLRRSFYAGFSPHLLRAVASWFIKFSVAERVAEHIGAA
jgi:hypothetical protein